VDGFVGGQPVVHIDSARALADDGANVVISGRTEEACREAVAAIGPSHGQVSYLAGDIADEAVAESPVNKCVESFGGVDSLLNNAGFTRDKSLVTWLSKNSTTSCVSTSGAAGWRAGRRPGACGTRWFHRERDVGKCAVRAGRPVQLRGSQGRHHRPHPGTVSSAVSISDSSQRVVSDCVDRHDGAGRGSVGGLPTAAALDVRRPRQRGAHRGCARQPRHPGDRADSAVRREGAVGVEPSRPAPSNPPPRTWTKSDLEAALTEVAGRLATLNPDAGRRGDPKGVTTASLQVVMHQ
jgi:hypothetical protein